MQDVITISTIARDDSPRSHESRLDSPDHGAVAGDRASTHATTSRPSWQKWARDLHPGDVVQQFDWPLHIRAVTLCQTVVEIRVAEFDFPLHYAADARVQLAA